MSSRQGPTCTTPVKEESEAHGPTTNVKGQKAQRIKGGTRGQAGSMGPHGTHGLPKAIKQDPIAPNNMDLDRRNKALRERERQRETEREKENEKKMLTKRPQPPPEFASSRANSIPPIDLRRQGQLSESCIREHATTSPMDNGEGNRPKINMSSCAQKSPGKQNKYCLQRCKFKRTNASGIPQDKKIQET